MTKVDYPVGDFLIRLKNTVMAGNGEFESINTKLTRSVLKVLKEANYVGDYEEKGDTLLVKLAMFKKKPTFVDLKLISKPGLRVYMSKVEIEARKSPTSLIISTNKGVMMDKDAIKNNVGGEVIVEIL